MVSYDSGFSNIVPKDLFFPLYERHADISMQFLLLWNRFFYQLESRSA